MAALLVVVLHAASYVSADPRYWNRPDLFHLVLGLHLGVEYFLVLSGTVILLAHRRDIGRPKTIPSYLWKRFRRIYPAYWVVLTLVVLEYVLRPGLGSSYQSNPLVILSSYLLVHLGTIQTNLPIGWTLFLEILFYGTFATILINRRWGTVVLSVWGAICFAYIFLPVTHPLLAWYLFSPLNLLFLLGLTISSRVRSGNVRYPRAVFAAGIAMFGVAYLACCLPIRQTVAIELGAGLGAACLILGGSALERLGKLAVPKSLQFLGAASYSIYLVHYPVLMFVAPVVFKFWKHSPFPLALAIAGMTAVALTVGCVMHVAIEQPLLKWLSSTKREVPEDIVSPELIQLA